MATTTNWKELEEYVNVHRDELLTKASTDAKTIRYFDLYLNIKHKDIVPILTTEAVLQDGSECGWNPDGSVNFGEMEVEVFPTESEMELCQRDLEKTFVNYQLKWAAGRETLPFEEAIYNSIIESIQEKLETGLWQGIQATGMPGVIAQLGNNLVTVIDPETTDGEDIVTKIDKYVAKIPQNAFKAGKDGKYHIFLSYTDFRAYVKAVNDACCNRAPIDANTEELVYAGDSRVVLIPVAGLEGTGKIIGVPAEGFGYATDVEGSESTMDAWFDRKEAKFLNRVLFMAGTAVKYPFYTIMNR